MPKTIKFLNLFIPVINQSIKNRLTIYDNENNVIYNEIQETFRLNHELPANVLENGKTYNCDITAYFLDGNEEKSITSGVNSRITIYCFTTPVWKFKDFETNKIINNSTLTLELEYEQIEDEKINEYKVTLYNSNMTSLWNSGNLFYPISSVEISGLADNNMYYIRAEGNTVNKFDIDTGYIPFSITYDKILLNQVINLDNIKDDATVKITSNVIIINGKSVPNNPKYIENKHIDLREQNNSVVFDEDFSLNNDFIIELYGYGFKQNKSFLVMGDKQNEINLFWRKNEYKDTDGQILPYTFVELYSGRFVKTRNCKFLMD